MDLEGPSVLPSSQLPTHITEKATGSYGVHDTLRYGFASAKEDLSPAHPLEHLQSNYTANQDGLMMQVVQNAQGRNMPLRLQMERRIVSRIQRMPPLESSMVALETLTGTDNCLAVEDVLNPPSEAPVTVDTHHAMEQRLKMNS